MPHEFGRSEIRVAFDEEQRNAPFAGDGPQHGGFAGARRAFQDYVASGGDGREREFKLALAADQVRGNPVPGVGDSRCLHFCPA